MLGLAACAGPAERLERAEAVARSGGLAAGRVVAGPFDLAVWQRPGAARELTVYIEGDGFAWAERSRPSPDPTPLEPLALRLASLDPSPAVAALARPCQYRSAAARPQPVCDDPRWWTGDRFSTPVIDAVGHALDALKRRAGAERLHLVGFSGGAAVAVLAAARRTDVDSLRSVAGNLDPALVNRLHGVDPPGGGPSPTDAARALAGIPQIHFAGNRDRVVPPAVARSFAAAAGGRTGCVRVMAVDADHHDGWVGHWPALLAAAPSCAAPPAGG